MKTPIPFEIISNRGPYSGAGDFGIRYGDKRLSWLCWDEMLGCVARLGLGMDCGSTADMTSGEAPLYTLRLTPIEDCYWTIENGNRFIDHLAFSEMLGFIACFTRTGEQLFRGFRTYEDIRGWKYSGLNKPVKALLESR